MKASPQLQSPRAVVRVLDHFALILVFCASEGYHTRPWVVLVITHSNCRVGLRGGGGVGMGVSGMVFVGLVLGCIEAKFCK